MTSDRSLKLLISNDDGISALGVRTLANTLATAGYQVTVVCPDGERSATGHGLTLHHPIPVSYTHLTLPTNREV